MAKKKEKLIQEQGACPRCGSHNMDYGDTDLDGESMGYDFTCKDCGTYGKEWYDMTYSETIIEGQDR